MYRGVTAGFEVSINETCEYEEMCIHNAPSDAPLCICPYDTGHCD